MNCQKCKYEWKEKVKKPRQCPRCKRYDYDKENKIEEVKNGIV